jgi:predicted acetyltransferase
VAHDIDIRLTNPDEVRVACDTMRAALLMGPTSDSDWEIAAPGWEHDEHHSISAWDGGRCVGHAGALRFDTVVPGGARLPTAGVTRVGVTPTHTRRGLLSRMMRRLLDDMRADGTVLASLRASEAVIYGRFGYGVAGESSSVRLDVRRARGVRGAAPGSLRILGRDEILDVVPAIYDRCATRAGAITRSPYLWTRYLGDALRGDKASFVVVHTGTEGVDDGFAHATVQWDEAPFAAPVGAGEVHDVFGTTPAVELALWDHLLGIDLIHRYDVEERPLDDPLRLAVRDLRACEVRAVYDEQWMRLLDVGAALAARTYRPASSGVRIEVVDSWYADNCGVVEISSDGAHRSTAAPDLRVDIATLSAAYLGSTSWTSLAAVGLVDGDADAVARADDLFAHRPGAWCGSHF